MSDICVSLQGVSKRFGATQALTNVSFTVRKGSVHALVGENGAGKSTLMNILSGSLLPDAGEIAWYDTPVRISTPRAARSLGIAMIHQELAAAENLTIAQNIMLGHEPRQGLFINNAALNEQAAAQLERLNLDFAPETPIRKLTVGQRQQVEIAKVLSLDAQLLIMDEPSSALSKAEIDSLFTIIRSLQKSGITILYISHRLAEIFAICDMVTVLRDGAHVKTEAINNLDSSAIIQMMVGEAVKTTKSRTPCYTSEVIMRTVSISRQPHFQNVSLAIRKGEVYGLFGLLGAGRTEVAHALFGLQPAISGTIEFKGKEVDIQSIHDARMLNIAYVPEDRKRQALFLNQSIHRNIITVVLKNIAQWLWVRHKEAYTLSKQHVQDLAVKTPNIQAIMSSLSGGNQQKVVLARWLASKPDLLILDEPTRGIDVKAKAQIYSLINQLSRSGMSILLISSELLEIVGICDTIGVMRNGELCKVFDNDQVTMDEIMGYAAGELHNE